jgi:hypothetical protein
MTTLNARANQAYQALIDELEAEDQVLGFSTTQGAFKEGWETGYKQARSEVVDLLVWRLEGLAKDPHGTNGEQAKWAFSMAAGIARELRYGGVTTDE